MNNIASHVRLFLLLISILPLGLLAQTTMTFNAEKDATIFSENVSGSNGTGSLFIGRTNQPALRRALVKFDISEIPTTATITSATINIRSSRQSSSSVDAHRLLADWGEGSTSGNGNGGGQPSNGTDGDATWSHAFLGDQAWNTMGGDFTSASSANSAVNQNVTATFEGDGVIEDVQSWVDGSEDNHGWIFIGQENQNSSAIRVTSREGGNNAPTLTVTFTEEAVCNASGGTIQTSTGGTEVVVCSDDVSTQMIDVSLSAHGGADNSGWIIADASDNILALPSAPPFNLGMIGMATMSTIRHISFDDGLDGLMMGSNIANLSGCFDLSNPISITISSTGDCAQMDTPMMHFQAHLTGMQHSSPIISQATGTIDAILSGNTLMVSGSFSNLSGDFDAAIAGGAHIHTGLAGSGGGVAFALTTDVSQDLKSGVYHLADNTFTLTDEEVATLKSRGYYINIHTTSHPAGEIRGQLLPSSDQYFHTKLLGSNEVPSIHSSGIGSVVLELRGDTLTASGSLGGFSSPIATDLAGGAHIHNGMSGTNGGVAFPLSLTIGTNGIDATIEAQNNVFVLSEEQKSQLIEEGLYINVHSQNNRSGELRGQIAPIAQTTFRAQLAGSQEVPAVMTNASGRMLLNYDGEGQITVSGTFNDLESNLNTAAAGGLHIHGAPAGRNAGVVFRLNVDVADDQRSGIVLPSKNTFDIDTEQLATLFSRGMYINVHSMDNGPGEVRGQLLPLAKSYMGTNLSGLNEVQPIISPGQGNIQFEINDNQLIATGGFSNMMGDFDASIAGGSHIHQGQATGNGGIAFNLNATPDEDLKGGTYSAAANTFDITDGQRDSLMQGYYYINIHTTSFASGELRGQVLRDDNSFPSPSFMTMSPQDGAAFTIDTTSSDLFEVLWQSSTDPNEDLLVYTWQLSADQDFSQLLMSGKVGSETAFRMAQSGLDALLEQNGLDVGSTGAYFHRVLASDGSVSKANNPFSISLTRAGSTTCPQDLNGGLLSGGPFSFCVGDGVSDHLEEGAVMLSDNVGSTSQWIITDENNNIIGLPTALTGVDFESFSPGQCLIHHISYEDDLNGLAIGGSIDNLAGCFHISNPITVEKLSGSDCDQGSQPQSFRAVLSGTQHNAPVLSSARGMIDATLTGNMLSLTGTFSDLQGDFNSLIAGGAHIHYGIAGKNGDVAFLLTTATSSDLRSGTYTAEDNTFELSDEQVDVLKSRGFYINIHTTAYPSGEIRGQLLPASDAYFHTRLLGSNEVPVVISAGLGQVVLELDGNQLTASGSFYGLGSPIATDLAGGAHIHTAMAGRSGGVAFPLTLTIDEDGRGAMIKASENQFGLTDEQMASLEEEGLYINIHSQDIRSGELRGQIAPISSMTFRAQLAGAQEVPAVMTSAHGRIMVNYDGGGNITVSGTFNGLEGDLLVAAAGGMHIHDGQAGRNGGIAFGLNMDISDDNSSAVILPSQNTFPISEAQLATLFERGNYVNVHSAASPSGELRGQLLPLSKSYLGTNLSGLNEVQPVMSTGVGDLQFEINDGQLIVTGGFSNMVGDFDASIAGGSHVHLSKATGNGGVAMILSATADSDLRGGIYTAADNTFDVSPGFIDSLSKGYYYVNIHTTAYPSGELRGQILRDDNAFPSASFDITSPAEGASIDISQMSEEAFTVMWEATADPDMDLIVYTWQLATDSEFSNMLVANKVGADLVYTMAQSEVANLLMDNGATVGMPFTLYHRVLASDGSASTIGGARSISLTLSPECTVEAGSLTGGHFEFCITDGSADYILAGTVLLSGSKGSMSQWVITDEEDNIISLPMDISNVDFEQFGIGRCQVRHLVYEPGLMGLEVGLNVNGLEGCSALTNSIEVIRKECPTNGCFAPVNIKVRKKPNRRFDISWDRGNRNVRGYEIMIGFKDKPKSFVTIPVRRNRVTISTSSSSILVIKVRAVCGRETFSEYSEVLEVMPNDKATGREAVRGISYGAFTVVNDQFSISPNPADQFIEVSLEEAEVHRTFEVFDISGRIVFQRSIDAGQSLSRIATSDLENGVYVIVITTETAILTQEQFVIAR